MQIKIPQVYTYIYIYTQINICFYLSNFLPQILLEVGIHHNENWRDPFFHCHLNRIPRFQTRMSGSSQKFSPSNRSQTSVRSYKTKFVPNLPPLVSFQNVNLGSSFFGEVSQAAGFPSSKKTNDQTITAHGGKNASGSETTRTPLTCSGPTSASAQVPRMGKLPSRRLT